MNYSDENDDDEDEDQDDGDDDDDDDDEDDVIEGSEMDAEFNTDAMEDSISFFPDDLDPFSADNDDNRELFLICSCLF